MFATQSNKDALVAIDQCPFTPEPELVTCPEIPEVFDISLPFDLGTTDVHQYLVLPDLSAIDYRSYTSLMGISVFDYNAYGMMPPAFVDDLQDSEVATLQTMIGSLNHRQQMNDCEAKCYEMLVQADKDLGFDQLVELKQSLFVEQ